MRLLTDPVLRSRVAHLQRLVPLNGAVSDVVGRPDAILISHLHFDHFDPRSIQLFDRGVPIVVPRGGAVSLLRRRGFTEVHGVDEGVEVPVGRVRVRAVQSNSNSEPLPNRSRSAALGWVSSRKRWPG